MPKFEILEDKAKAKDLKFGDHVMLQDMLWLVVDNFPVIGGAGRMLQLAYYTHTTPSGFKFHPTESETRFDVFRLIP